jgi:hypothetical protein
MSKAPARTQEILEEEEYTSAISRIVERDFFPTLAALRAYDRAFSSPSGNCWLILHTGRGTELLNR